MKRLLAAALIALAPAAAVAQTVLPPPPNVIPPPPRPDRLAEARAEAQRMIAVAQAEGIFENITDHENPKVRHIRSGMICEFVLGESNIGITIFDQGLGLPRGDDVGCNTPRRGLSITIYATRYGGDMTAQRALARAEAEIRARWPGITPYTGETWIYPNDRAGRAPAPRAHYARFQGNLDGVQRYTQATVAEFDGWIIKQRVTGDAGDPRDVQSRASIFWNLTINSVVDGGGTPI